MAHQEMVIAWLNDAYAMENSLIRTLEHRVNDTKDYPHSTFNERGRSGCKCGAPGRIIRVVGVQRQSSR